MKSYFSGVITGIIVGILLSGTYTASRATPQTPTPVQITRFKPAIISIEAQTLGEIAAKSWEISNFYIEKFRARSPDAAAAANYVDALAAVEVMADRWLRSRGIQPTSDHYRAFLCLLSWGVGCPPKPEQTRRTMLAVRDRLIDSAFFRESRREDIRRRLREVAVDAIPVQLSGMEIDRLIDLSGLR